MNFVNLLQHQDSIRFMSYRPTQRITSAKFSDTVEYASHLKSVLDKYFTDKPSDVYAELFTPTYVGGDPEFFVEDNDNNIIPSYHFLGTTPESHENFCVFGRPSALKPVNFSPDKQPYVIANGNNLEPRLWWLHPDGVQLEFGYFPSTCMEITGNYIRDMLLTTNGLLRNKNLRLSTRTSAAITPGQAMEAPLGCRPSYNAHNIDNNIYDKNPMKRFTGGHFHFTMLAHPWQTPFYVDNKFSLFNPSDIEAFESIYSLQNINETVRQEFINKLVRVMDATLGMFSVAVAGEHDDPGRRQHHYGMAGDYRLTTKTLEYRVPSNTVWMNPVTWHIMGMMGRFLTNQFKTAHISVEAYNFYKFHDEITDWGEVVDIINNTDYQAARKWWADNNEKIRNLFAPETKIANHWYKINKLASDGMFKYLKPLVWDRVSPYYPYPRSLKMLEI